MISSLHGTVLEVSATSAVIEVGGVGMSVQASPTTLASLRVGEESFIHTELVVREESLTLFGFADADERSCFRVLLGAKGVGAKLALSILSVHTPNSLRYAIAQQDVAALKRVPGLGPKGAQRIIIDIGDKLGPATAEQTTIDGSADRLGAPIATPNEKIVTALTQLGWNEATAVEAVGAVELALKETADPQELSATPITEEELLRAALKWLGERGHRA